MQLTILQWNVWYKENVERVLDVLKTRNADIICLQELTRGYLEQTHENTWEYLAHELGYHYRHQEIPIITADSQWSQANAILCRFPIQHSFSTWLHKPLHAEDLHDQYRGYLEITIDTPDGPLTVATTHMSFRPPMQDNHELNRLLAILDDRPARFILTGDLNAMPDSPQLAAISQRLRHAGPPYSQPTWPTKPFSYDDGTTISTPERRYDYIFASPDITVRHAAILQTDVSDHLPVIATVELPQAGPLQ
jgi:endonuclease/exonuclease/phosphatase family metal-dependent hydrolase